MTWAQEAAPRCGMIPEDNVPEFVAQHLSAYAFMRPQVVGKKILEVGFGDGYGAAYLAEVAQEVVGVDIAPENVPRACGKYPLRNLSFLGFNGSELPFSDGSFDAACAFQVIEHIPEPRLVFWLTEVRRVLVRGGFFYLSTLNLEHARKPGVPYEKLVYHEKEFTAAELASLLLQVFPRVQLFGLHPKLPFRFFKRLKKWGFKVPAYFNQVTTRDFAVSSYRVHCAMDLIAVCEKAY